MVISRHIEPQFHYSYKKIPKNVWVLRKKYEKIKKYDQILPHINFEYGNLVSILVSALDRGGKYTIYSIIMINIRTRLSLHNKNLPCFKTSLWKPSWEL